MGSFTEIEERAEKRKGGPDALKALMPKTPNHDALRALPDDRILSEMTRYVFYAGFVRNIIDAKWPGFEAAFSAFDLAFLNFAPDDYWHDLTSDARVVRNGAKIMSVQKNAQFIRQIADEHGSAGRFFADWPITDHIGLLAVLDKRADRLGGMSGQYLLRAIGRDSFVMSHDVLVCLRLSGLPISEGKPGKKDLRLIQDQFNAWHAETGLPLTYLSRICAFSVGMPGEEDDV
ncbi:3-methyladenine DNA glycosylase [Rhizobium sp. AC27/96]|uniref:DNA-3-methyladenine glycosylase I n=1 Tax=Rhizobium sp. AC27/96 TaxID=1841653 RepID=UPI0008278798|nr:DNA-3-methyladenine glycosylase I [Rhizobium sp. AC27/96]OCI93284.1 3-methyladenine DNA glycosylase [Rhizobium sp. AC27/96]